MVEFVIINGMVVNSRQRYLAEMKLVGPSPIENAISIANDMFPGAFILVVSNSEHVLGACSVRLNGNSRLVRVDDTAAWRDFPALLDISSEAEVVVLSPFDGVVSAQRTRTVLTEHEAHAPRLSLSVSLVDNNAHPSFNRVIPVEMTGRDICPIEENQEVAFDPEAHIDAGVQESFPHASKIFGSQWLPKLYRADKAIAVGTAGDLRLADSADADGVRLCVAEDDGDCDVLVYKLPVFLFNEASLVRST